MAEIDGYELLPLTSDRFDDLETVLGKGGISGCWCMYWVHPTTKIWSDRARGGSKAANRDDLLQLLAAGPPPGILAYDEETPAAWCRIMPRTALPGLARSRFFKTDLDISGVWSLPCFVVRRQYRGKGLTTVLVKGAIDFVRERGGATLEAYPWDTTEKKDPAVVYTGLASTFERLGFHVVQRRADHKPMMRLELHT